LREATRPNYLAEGGKRSKQFLPESHKPQRDDKFDENFPIMAYRRNTQDALI